MDNTLHPAADVARTVADGNLTGPVASESSDAAGQVLAILGAGMHPWGKWGKNFVEYGVVAAVSLGVAWYIFDVVTPLASAWALSKAWPKADFKIVWDAGHASTEPGIIDGLIRAGDEALKALAATVSKTLRPSDMVARYGGEEFVVLLPDTPADEGQLQQGPLRHAASAVSRAALVVGEGPEGRGVDGQEIEDGEHGQRPSGSRPSGARSATIRLETPLPRRSAVPSCWPP